MTLEQLIRLVSQSPENLAYHILILLVSQAAAAIALWQWGRNREDRFALRLGITALVIFVLRTTLAVLIAIQPPEFARENLLAFMPVLERGLDVAILMFALWAFIPPPKKLPRLNHLLLGVGLVVLVVGGLSAQNEWRSTLFGTSEYALTQQASIWMIVVLILLANGVMLLVSLRPFDWLLRILTLLPFGLAAIAQLVTPATLELDSFTRATPYWSRFAYLVALPLLAVIAYRHSIYKLLTAQADVQNLKKRTASVLNAASQTLQGEDLEKRLPQLLSFVAEQGKADFVGVALRTAENSPTLALTTHHLIHQHSDKVAWPIRISDWPAVQLALTQQRPMELLPDGVGARQLFAFQQELGLTYSTGALLMLPLKTSPGFDGLLLAGAPLSEAEWSEENKILLGHIAAYVGRVIANGQVIERLKEATSGAGAESGLSQADQEKISALTRENAHYTARIESLSQQLDETEATLVIEQKKRTDLLKEIEGQPTNTRLTLLEKEADALRESLSQAEEALALASAGEAGLSIDWVMNTITRYSGQVEEAQERINLLESLLNSSQDLQIATAVGEMSEGVKSSLRLMSIHTNKLLNGSSSNLDEAQRMMIKRMQTATNQIAASLAKVEEMTARLIENSRSSDGVDIQWAAETAVDTVVARLAAKRLQLDFNITPNLPAVYLRREDLLALLTHLLENATVASLPEGRVKLEIKPFVHHESGRSDEPPVSSYLVIRVTDTGVGIPADDRPLLFNGHNGGMRPSISGVSNDGAELQQAYDIVRAEGGRLWIDSLGGIGTTVWVLLPFYREQTAVATSPAAGSRPNIQPYA